MTRHLSTMQVEQFCVSALGEEELVAAAIHTAKCQSCHQRFTEQLNQRCSAPLNFTLEPEFWFRNDHLDFDDLVGLADNMFDQEILQIINVHLGTCESCREDLRSFLTYRDATAGEINIAYGPPHYQSIDDLPDAPWWQRVPRSPRYAAVAIVLVAIAVLIGVFALFTRSRLLRASKQPQTTSVIERNPSLPPSHAPSVVSRPSGVEDSAKIAVLEDADGEVTIDKNGGVTGLDGISENCRQYVAQAVLSEQIKTADIFRYLSGNQGGLRGNDNAPQELSLLYPVRRVVTEDRPVFRWKGSPAISSYRVYVLNAAGNQVSQSEELLPTQTRWKAPVPLRRGQVYSWVVSALVGGKKVVSPSASVPEMKFAVLSTTDFQELSDLKKSNSHLALGVYYARVGLLNEAEREFQRLLKRNPQSQLVRKLLQSLRGLRK